MREGRTKVVGLIVDSKVKGYERGKDNRITLDSKVKGYARRKDKSSRPNSGQQGEGL